MYQYQCKRPIDDPGIEIANSIHAPEITDFTHHKKPVMPSNNMHSIIKIMTNPPKGESDGRTLVIFLNTGQKLLRP